MEAAGSVLTNKYEGYPAKDTTEVAVVDVVELLLIEPKNYLEQRTQMYSLIQAHKQILRFTRLY
jgi:glycine/serine hydroxymethyltransferase